MITDSQIISDTGKESHWPKAVFENESTEPYVLTYERDTYSEAKEDESIDKGIPLKMGKVRNREGSIMIRFVISARPPFGMRLKWPKTQTKANAHTSCQPDSTREARGESDSVNA
jgi:hypothetical protein